MVKKPKLRTYVTFKDNVDVEPYVKYCNLRQNKFIMTQIIRSVHPIRLESGRFCRTKLKTGVVDGILRGIV